MAVLAQLALIAAISAAVLAATGCAQTTHLSRPSSAPRPETAVLLVMPVDVELRELTAGGMLEPKADWTEKAREHVAAAIAQHLGGRKVRLVPYQPPASDTPRAHQHAQIAKLHEAVATAIVLHKYGPPTLHLPTKEGFDWSLGPGVAVLREDHDADYALFVQFRDSYASAGRVALIFGAALLGVGVPGGQQVGFASLVDLRTGEVVWFNRLLNPAGDLRAPEPARDAVGKLLEAVPL